MSGMSDSAAQQAEAIAESILRIQSLRGRMLQMASDHFQPRVEEVDILQTHKPYPRFPIGISEIDSRWNGAQGLTVLTAFPGVGKSMLAVCCGILNATSGLPVFYFDAENSIELFQRRVMRFVGEHRYVKVLSELVETGMLTYIKPRKGQEFGQLIKFLVDKLDGMDALIITDSVNKIAKKLLGPREQNLYFAKINQICEWQDEVCQMTDGSIRFLTLSEANKEGEAKGKDAEHTCVMSIRMCHDEKPGVVRVSIGKHRDGPGYLELGRYRRMIDENTFERIVESEPLPDVEFAYEDAR